MIIDSLGWAYYRLGHYDEAVQELEKAIELKPGDPVINDHLGDAYWKVGRQLEARFQWQHAKDSNPEPEDLPLIVKKLEHGIEETPKAESALAEERRLIRLSPLAGRGLAPEGHCEPEGRPGLDPGASTAAL